MKRRQEKMFYKMSVKGYSQQKSSHSSSQPSLYHIALPQSKKEQHTKSSTFKNLQNSHRNKI